MTTTKCFEDALIFRDQARKVLQGCRLSAQSEQSRVQPLTPEHFQRPESSRERWILLLELCLSWPNLSNKWTVHHAQETWSWGFICVYRTDCMKTPLLHLLNINTIFAMLTSMTLDNRDTAAPPEVIWWGCCLFVYLFYDTVLNKSWNFLNTVLKGKNRIVVWVRNGCKCISCSPS